MTDQNRQQRKKNSPCGIFDSEHYIAINVARWEAVEKLIRTLPGTDLKTVFDVGCGPGWFADKFMETGMEVTGLEARPELVAEARLRVPSATFQLFNADHPLTPGNLPAADLVFCFGLLYHLENPFNAVRALKELTGRICLVELIITPGPDPIFRFTPESSNINQGFTHFAIIPTLSTTVAMLYAAGFGHVYEFTGPIAHADFEETPTMLRRRHVLLSSHNEIIHNDLQYIPPVHIPKYDYRKTAP